MFIDKLDLIKWKIVIVITWEFDIKHSKNEDEKIISFFNQNGCLWKHLYLPNYNIHWNWHILFAENNSLKIFDLIYKNIGKYIQ